MTASKILRKRAERFGYVVAFTPDEVLALADCIEAAERITAGSTHIGQFNEKQVALASALTVLREHLEGGTEGEPDIPIQHRPQDDLTDEERAQVEKELERRLAEHLEGGDVT